MGLKGKSYQGHLGTQLVVLLRQFQQLFHKLSKVSADHLGHCCGDVKGKLASQTLILTPQTKSQTQSSGGNSGRGPGHSLLAGRAVWPLAFLVVGEQNCSWQVLHLFLWDFQITAYSLFGMWVQGSAPSVSELLSLFLSVKLSITVWLKNENFLIF